MLKVSPKYLPYLILYQLLSWFFGCSNGESENEDRKTTENALIAADET
jgi:hypothetical protein